MTDERTYKIIGCAMEVHRELGCGFLEAVYQEALGREFNLKGVPNTAQPIIEILYGSSAEFVGEREQEWAGQSLWRRSNSSAKLFCSRFHYDENKYCAHLQGVSC